MMLEAVRSREARPYLTTPSVRDPELASEPGRSCTPWLSCFIRRTSKLNERRVAAHRARAKLSPLFQARKSRRERRESPHHLRRRPERQRGTGRHRPRGGGNSPARDVRSPGEAGGLAQQPQTGPSSNRTSQRSLTQTAWLTGAASSAVGAMVGLHEPPSSPRAPCRRVNESVAWHPADQHVGMCSLERDA